MKLILKENMAELGYKYDVVEVKDGYGRNYLIPQGKAIIASKAALKRLAEEQKQRAEKIAKAFEEAQVVAQALEGVRPVIEASANKNGNIYGSVTAAHIAEALQKLGHDIDRKVIFLKNPVRQLGSYSATIKLHRDVNPEVEFDVVAKVEEEA